MRNELQLTASVVREDALRYTPAGLPVLQVWLNHQARQLQGGLERDVGFEIQAVLIGELALQYAGKLTGQTVLISGFIAQRSLRNQRLVLHIESIEWNKD